MMMRRLAIAVMVAVCGCSSKPRPVAQPEPIPDERPVDFVLAATVFTPENLKTDSLPRSLRPARYIVEADGALRASVGPGATVTTFPPQTRQLTAKQVDGLWRQIRETDLLDAGNPARVNDPEAIPRTPDRTTALVYVGYSGKRVTLRLLLDRASEDSLAAERLMDRLAELAWIKN